MLQTDLFICIYEMSGICIWHLSCLVSSWHNYIVRDNLFEVFLIPVWAAIY